MEQFESGRGRPDLGTALGLCVKVNFPFFAGLGVEFYAASISPAPYFNEKSGGKRN